MTITPLRPLARTELNAPTPDERTEARLIASALNGDPTQAVLATVARFTGVSVDQILGNGRRRRQSAARAACCWLMAQEGMSHHEIAGALRMSMEASGAGHAIRRTNRLRAIDSTLRARLDAMLAAVQSYAVHRHIPHDRNRDQLSADRVEIAVKGAEQRGAGDGCGHNLHGAQSNTGGCGRQDT